MNFGCHKITGEQIERLIKVLEKIFKVLKGGEDGKENK